jgi:hypothetical protein
MPEEASWPIGSAFSARRSVSRDFLACFAKSHVINFALQAQRVLNAAATTTRIATGNDAAEIN